jgi:hypothetical protein
LVLVSSLIFLIHKENISIVCFITIVMVCYSLVLNHIKFKGLWSIQVSITMIIVASIFLEHKGDLSI